MTTPQIDDIGLTALYVAAFRAAETARPDRIADDPYAADFLAAAGMTGAIPGDAARFAAVMRDQVAVRTRFLDDALLAATTTGGCRQVVLMASGMDARIHRLPWPDDTDLFELDQPAVLGFKQRVLADRSASTTGRHHPVGVDLRDDWAAALRAAGFRDDRPTAWLTEGLLYALDATTADTLLADIGALSTPGSMIGFDHIQRTPDLTEALIAVDPGLSRLWQTGPLDPVEWLQRAGWQARVVELAELSRQWGRPVHPAYEPTRTGSGHSWIGTGVRPG